MAYGTKMEQYFVDAEEERKAILADSSEPETKGFTKVSQIWRNLFVLETAMAILFSAFLGLEQLQSSLFSEEGMGTIIFATVYTGFVISVLFLATPLITVFGAKWSILLSLIGYNLYNISYLHASWELFIPAAVMEGLCSFIYVARGVYLNTIAHDYAHLKGISNDEATSLIIGISEGFYKSSGIWGNLISSQILVPRNVSLTVSPVSDMDLSLCGNSFCPGNAANNTHLQSPTKQQLYLLAGSYTSCSLLAVVLVLFVQQLGSEKNKKVVCTKDAWKLSNVFATFSLLRDVRLILLMPLSVLTGMMRTAFLADYAEAFITCPLGIWWVGYVAICYSVVDGAASIGLGRLVKYAGRIPVFAIGFTFNAAALLSLLFYQVTTDKIYVYFILSGILGVADASLSVQLTALYGVLFKEDGKAAFSLYRLWRAVGYIISFTIQSQVCISPKIYMLLSMLTIGVIGYIVVEIIEKRKAKAA